VGGKSTFSENAKSKPDIRKIEKLQRESSPGISVQSMERGIEGGRSNAKLSWGGEKN